ncbi:endonuclease [Virgibacillus phasianinus]|uniref:Endonuclease n=1 Tax=Virgibacillus phasianinus TaxID=2017483 RepID=A0A220U245_9BACI|nr:endonuclease/exonuclease/phosphatase family protein [Virgibacillus phasianinus]ASK62218.1 endonuclease [Virgibacillus phasianinus]
MNLSVMTLNLRVNNPEDGNNAWPFRINRVSEVIKLTQPFIIGTQEGLFSMLSDLQKCLPEYGMIGSGRGGGREDEHCAIFYKKQEVEVKDHGQFWLSQTPTVANSISWKSACPRICTWGAFNLAKNPAVKFLVFNTHLDHVSQTAREKGIQLIWAKMNAYIKKGLPVILTGDLNAGPENKTIQFLHGLDTIERQSANLIDAFSVLMHAPGATFHDFRGGKEGQPIDYIYTSLGVKILETKVDRSIIDGGYPSDHYPVTADLII